MEGLPTLLIKEKIEILTKLDNNSRDDRSKYIEILFYLKAHVYKADTSLSSEPQKYASRIVGDVLESIMEFIWATDPRKFIDHLPMFCGFCGIREGNSAASKEFLLP